MNEHNHYIPKPESGRRFAVGDIHGCAKTFQALVTKQIRLQPTDQLFLLGDYVHRGPDSLGVLDYIMDLTSRGFQVFPLSGNHEEMFLRYNEKEIDPVYVQFIKGLSLYYKTDTHWLVHAGFNFYAKDPLQDHEALVWGPSTYVNPPESFLEGRQIVCGHRVHKLSKTQTMISEKKPVIVIDNGCYQALRNQRFEIGNLLALNLDSSELLIQPNIDKLRGDRWENF